MIVYITTNLVNGKKYIGKDENNVKSYMGSGIGIVNAIKKYGKKNFVKEILAECETSDQLNELEIYYINYYNAQESELFTGREQIETKGFCVIHLHRPKTDIMVDRFHH